MDDPVTDIAFVSNESKCPKGYTLVAATPCGHRAQLWEKVLGGEDGERFLCFTKEDKDGLVVEDMYIPGRSDQYLYKGYKIVKKTVEGDEPMWHKQLAVKKVKRSEAKKVVADIIVCKSKDEISQMYKKTGKSVNNLTICFRLVDYKPKESDKPSSDHPTSTGRTRRNSDPEMERISVSEVRRRATISPAYINSRMEGLSVSGQTSRGAASVPIPDPVHTIDYASTAPSQPVNEPAQLHYTPSLGSAKPPPSSYIPPASYNHTHTDPHHPEPPTTSYPTPPTTNPTPPTTHSTPTTSYPTPTTSSYPPAGSYPPSYPQPAGYPAYPPQPGPGYYPSYQPSGPPRQPPPRAPAAPTGYNTGIGFSFNGPSYPPPPTVGYPAYTSGADPGFVAAPPSGPAPFNPYHHGPATYPPTGPAPYPPSGVQPSGQNYGFRY